MPAFVDSSDFLNNSSILASAAVSRAIFDPANPEHLDSVRSFLDTGKWGKIQFRCEFPFTDVPTTVLTKFATHQICGTSINL